MDRIHKITNYLPRHPLVFVLFVVIGLLTTGTIGYHLIEGWSFFEALFMTVITVTTIGYGEVRPLSELGRVFTIVLILVGVVAFTYAISTTVEQLLSTEFQNYLRNRRRQQKLRNLENHTIICGFGRMGRSLAQELIAKGAQVLVIDMSDDAIADCQELGITTIQGNATDEAVLSEAKIDQAKALVTVTPSDAENVFIVLTARGINQNLQIISRCNDENSIPKMHKAGVNQALSPYAIAGQRIAHMITQPNVIQFLDGILQFGDHKMRIEEFFIQENSPFANLTLREARLGVVVLAVDHPGEMVLTHPQADTRLLPGTAIIVMGLEKDLKRVEKQIQG